VRRCSQPAPDAGLAFSIASPSAALGWYARAVELSPAMLAGFVDELEKIGVSHGLTHVSKARSGTRPISVDRLLEKDREGSLLKKKHASASPGQESQRPSVVGAAEGLGAAGLALQSRDRVADLVGARRIYHGADKPGAEGILRTVLDPSRDAHLRDPILVDKGKAGLAFVATDRGVARSYAGNSGRVLSGAVPEEMMGVRFRPSPFDPHGGTAFATKQLVEPQVFRHGLTDVAAKRLRDPGSYAGYLQKNTGRALKGAMGLAAVPALGYAAYRSLRGAQEKQADSAGNPQDVRGDSCDDPGAAQIPHRKGETPTKGSDDISVSQKTGMSGYQEIMLPTSSGEEMRAGNSKPRAYGEVPCQDQYIDVANAKSPIGGRPITSDVSAKKPKPGDTPTSDRNMNIVDRYDQRENATTVTGLGQSSTGIGAFNSPAEHT
jgi:hypothetical protein